MNKTLLKGNLGKDPKIIEVQNKRIAFLRVATTQRWQKDGKDQISADWHDVVVFKDNDVRYAAEYLKSGDEVFIDGKLKYRQVDQPDGTRIQVARVVISSQDDSLRGFFSASSDAREADLAEKKQGTGSKEAEKTRIN